MRARVGVLVAAVAVITLVVPSTASAANTTVALSGTAVATPDWFDLPVPVCPPALVPHRVSFDLQDQFGHAWVFEGSGCTRVLKRYPGGSRQRGAFTLRREGTTSPTLLGKYRGSFVSYKGVSRYDLALKVRKQDPKVPRERARGSLVIVEICGQDFETLQPVCSATFSGTLTADASFFS